MQQFAVLTKTGAGLQEYLQFLSARLTELTQKTPA
jgi:hypothetical protein